jgi:hypothetical protein
MTMMMVMRQVNYHHLHVKKTLVKFFLNVNDRHEEMGRE